MFLARRKSTLVAATLALSVAALLSFARTSSAALPNGPHVLEFDCAMDGTSFSFEGATNANGAPAKGTPFVVEGYLYPGGTFAEHGELSGVLPDGSPEFPDRVIGKWICRGWHLLDGDAPTGAVVATTQIFEFDPDQPGENTITTEGIELADFNVWFSRTITGGTGILSNASGQHRQIYVGDGLNATEGFNTSFLFDFRGTTGF